MDKAARIKDLTERIEGIKGELTDSATGQNVYGVKDPADVFFNSRDERFQRLNDLERELADLQGEGAAAGLDTSLDYPSITVPDRASSAGATEGTTGTYSVGDVAPARAEADVTASAAPPAAPRPRTQERPGTGAKEPKPEPTGERASGQITDKTGEYGPVRYSDPTPRPPRVEDPDVPGSGIGGRASEPGPAGGQITDEDGVYGEPKVITPRGWKADDWVDERKVRSPRAKGSITDDTGQYGPRRTSVPKVVKYGAAVVAVVLVAGALQMRSATGPSSVASPQAASSAAAPAPAAPATVAPAAAAPAGPSAPTAASAGYRCVGNQISLFDSSNTSLVTNGGTPPTFSTNGKPYCLVSVSTYHWNSGRGATPGRIGLIGGAGNVGPVQTQSGTGVPNADWVYVPAADARPLLEGSYTCTDSDPATWSANQASGGRGFCRVWVQEAVK